MASTPFADLRRVRGLLGKSQSEMAALLGISTRAVQSYEQGWRPTAPYVQRAAALFWFLSRRKDKPKAPPCWRVRKCDAAARAACPAYQFQAGDLCWLFPPSPCSELRGASWEDRIAVCEKCAVMRSWLEP